jgi:phosphocarrier protein HPr
MIVREVVVKNDKGLHLRPCDMISRMAMRFSSEITITSGGKKVDAKSIMSLLTLAVHKGSIIKIEANGKDEKEAIEELVKLFETGFDEE